MKSKNQQARETRMLSLLTELFGISADSTLEERTATVAGIDKLMPQFSPKGQAIMTATRNALTDYKKEGAK